MELGLERIKTLLNTLGNPQHNQRIIHVAGTNGKGSTVALIAYALAVNQYKVGTFSSPYFLVPEDGIKINNQTVDTSLYNAMKQLVLENNIDINATAFEMETAIAFLCFQKEDVDFWIIEVGMGGRLDSTNVVDSMVSVITNIGFDHVEFLGNTIELIAAEKAGIIKSNNIACVIGYQDYPAATQVIINVAHDLNVKIDVSKPAEYCDRNYAVYIGGHKVIVNDFCSKYQLCNAGTAASVLNVLLESGINIDINTIPSAFASAHVPGRMTTIEYKNIPILVDGAHNLSGCSMLKEYLNSVRNGRKIVFVCGFSGTRDAATLINATTDTTDTVLVTSFKKPDNMPWVKVQDPQQIVSKANRCKFIGNLAETLDYAIKQNEMVVIFGSLYLVADIYRLL